MESLNLHIPANIEFGSGAVELTGIKCGKFGTRALVIADQVTRGTGIVDTVVSSLEAGGIQAIVFDAIPENATSSVLPEIVKLGRAGRALFVVGVGDETVLSVAQLAAAFIPRNVDLDSLFRTSDATEPLPFAGIPTRAGHPHMFTDRVLYVDSRDRSIATLDTGKPADMLIMDPMCMSQANTTILTYITVNLLLTCIEAFCSKRATFLSDIYAREALSILSPLVEAPESVNADAIEAIYQSGLLTALCSVHTGIGLGGILARCLAAKMRVPAIAVAAILTPEIVRLQHESVPERMAAAQTFDDAPGGMLSAAGLPLQLRDLDIEKGDLLNAAYMAYETDMARLSLIPVTAEELHSVLERVY